MSDDETGERGYQSEYQRDLSWFSVKWRVAVLGTRDKRRRVYRFPVTWPCTRLTGKVVEADKSGNAVKSQIIRRKSPGVYR
jgi:hypothetical protein